MTGHTVAHLGLSLQQTSQGPSSQPEPIRPPLGQQQNTQGDPNRGTGPGMTDSGGPAGQPPGQQSSPGTIPSRHSENPQHTNHHLGADQQEIIRAEILRLQTMLENPAILPEPLRREVLYVEPGEKVAPVIQNPVKVPTNPLGEIIPGFKANTLELPIPPKVEDAFRTASYVPYIALSHAARVKAA
ncbi:hypothetical protein M422DRAFT_239660 [Sphaerobolus stellatus SS14]|nr:hypothetical protein M422DRAFT_239660 [Sphaerobolus stellatus SS14]